MHMLSLMIVVDNIAKKPFKSEWGFSAFMDWIDDTTHTEIKALMDVGPSFSTLMHNANLLGLDLKSINFVFISHSHFDHTGALPDLLELSKSIEMVVIPSSYKLSSHISSITVKSYDTFSRIKGPFYSSGTLGGWTKEQSLVVLTECGPFVVTGCSHPDVKNIVYTVYNAIKRPITLVIGGFHRSTYSEGKKITEALKSVGVKYIIPCHCTGNSAKRGIFDNVENYFDCMVGLNIICKNGEIHISYKGVS